MNDLLQRAIAAHGGLAHFQEFQTVSADVSIGGALWALKGRPPRTNVRVTVDLRRERVEFTPFGGPSQRGVFTPHHLTVETAEGAVVAERVDPRAAFASDTPANRARKAGARPPERGTRAELSHCAPRAITLCQRSKKYHRCAECCPIRLAPVRLLGDASKPARKVKQEGVCRVE